MTSVSCGFDDCLGVNENFMAHCASRGDDETVLVVGARLVELERPGAVPVGGREREEAAQLVHGETCRDLA